LLDANEPAGMVVARVRARWETSCSEEENMSATTLQRKVIGYLQDWAIGIGAAGYFLYDLTGNRSPNRRMAAT
jgi:hypothetical protein